MKKNLKPYIIIVSGALLIIALQIGLSIGGDKFVGTDDQSVEIIQQIDPDYKPWATNIVEFKNEWNEIIVFVLQAVIGLSIIVAYIFIQRKKTASSI